MDETESQQERLWSKNFIIVCLSNFFVFLGFQMLMPTLPLYIHELGGSNFFLGLMVGGFTLSSLLIRPWAGAAVDIHGRGLILLAGLVIYALSVGVMAFFTGLVLLFTIRLLQGLGFGMSTTASGTVVTDLIPPRRRGEGMGFYGLALSLSMAIGPGLGLVMAQRTSFAILFISSAALGIVAFILALFIKYQPVQVHGTMSGIIKGVDAKPDQRFWDHWVERSSLRPSLLMGLICVTFGGISSFLPLYAQQQGIGHFEWYFFIYAISLMITRPLAGILYDKKGMQAVFLPGSLSMLLSMLLLTQVQSLWLLLFIAFFNGAGFGTVQPALQAWAVEEAPRHRKGMANATFFSFLDLGIGLGAITFGALASWIGYSGIYYGAAFAVFSAILLYIPFARFNRHKSV